MMLLIVKIKPRMPIQLILMKLLKENPKQQYLTISTIKIYDYQLYNQDIYTARPTEFSFNITAITKTSFSTIIYCPLVGRFYGFRFTWIAINDNRIKVINQLNQTMVGKVSETLSYTHNNKNYVQAFVSINGLGFGGLLDFKYEILNVTTDKVFIKFTHNTTNLLQLGYQIILGTSGAFTINPLFKMAANTPNQTAVGFDTGFIPVQSDETLIIPYAGLFYKYDINIRQTRLTKLSNSSGIQYSYESWDGSYIDIYAQKVWMKQSITQVFIPFLCKKIRTVRTSNPNAPLLPQMTLKILELNVQYSNTASESFNLDKSITNLNLIVSFQCNVGQRIQGTIKKCMNCNVNQWIINQDCYRVHNYVVYYINLVQKDNVYQYIQIDVTQSGFTITQTVINQVSSTQTVCSMEIIAK